MRRGSIMYQISKEDMILLLSENVVDNCSNIIDITCGGDELYISDREKTDYFIKYRFREKIIYEIASEEPLFCNECFVKIREDDMDILKLYVRKPEILYRSSLLESYSVIDKESHVDLRLLAKPDVPNPQLKIQELKKEDQEKAAELVCERTEGRPDFQTLFRIYMSDDLNIIKKGTIYAVLEEEHIAAYLACYNTYQNIFNVDYVYVVPEKRGFNYGAELIKYYANDIIKKGYTPIYGNAVNQFSMKAALKAGFSITKTNYVYSLIKKLI
jgi:GNAT superfamily N-acetyltransferase